MNETIIADQTTLGEWQRLLDAEGLHPHRNGDSLDSECPYHRGMRPELRIWTVDDGTLETHCSAGCTSDDIARMLTELRDTYPPGSSPNGQAVSVPLTRTEARSVLNELTETYRDTILSGRRCCWLTAEFYDREGPAALTIDCPDAYLAKILNISRQHVHRLKQAGRVLRVLSPTGDKLPDLPERQIRPLTRLLDDPQKVRTAYEKAKTNVGDGERLTYQHVAAAVDNELPQDTKQTKNKIQAAEQTTPRAPGRGGWVRELWQAAAAWVDRLNEDRNTPPDLRAALELVLKLAWTLAHEPQPDKDTNSLWTPNNKSSDLAHGGLGPVTPQKKPTGKQRAHTGTSLASSRADQVLPSRSQSRL